jgi:hypothetical protein
MRDEKSYVDGWWMRDELNFQLSTLNKFLKTGFLNPQLSSLIGFGEVFSSFNAHLSSKVLK